MSKQSDTGPHAWLFQFKGGERVSRWRKRTPGRPATWPARRWDGLMREDDPVFFWQTTAEGGLRGRGRIAAVQTESERTRRTIRVIEEIWLNEPVLRQTILNEKIFDPDNLPASSILGGTRCPAVTGRSVAA